MRIEKLTPQQWSYLSETAHLTVFGKLKPATFDRIDYALLVVDAEKKPLSYLTARELDHESVYWQFGGSFPETIGTTASLTNFRACIGYTKELGMKRISFLVENDNTAMLKLAMREGFKIVGIRNFKGTVLLEHLLEF